jgi:hypothetical protein
MVKPSLKRAGLDSSYRTYVHLAQGYLALPSVILCLRQCLLCIPYWPTSANNHSATLHLLFALRVSFHAAASMMVLAFYIASADVDGWTAPIIRSHFAHWLCAQG